jgi:hypothetical protein
MIIKGGHLKQKTVDTILTNKITLMKKLYMLKTAEIKKIGRGISKESCE